LLLIALAIINVDVDAIPPGEATLLVVNGQRGYLVPAKVAVGAAQTNFRQPIAGTPSMEARSSSNGARFERSPVLRVT
jgi:hypothetical protein